ncbi:hypothetical protein EYZ11_012210 [Aspergillus tanneri]|uniref:Uncharacterized protein n=1 Tax=Aspergillus tanneri TaxID=1220188 RepID=A0A4S3J0U2_9EURO|nr:hypothetical protein EYZ11_012210 [Aspergillus tanneri]
MKPNDHVPGSQPAHTLQADI